MCIFCGQPPYSPQPFAVSQDIGQLSGAEEFDIQNATPPPANPLVQVYSVYHFPDDFDIVERTHSQAPALACAVKFPFDKVILPLSAGFQVANTAQGGTGTGTSYKPALYPVGTV